MIRLLILVAVLALACRAIFGKWPWDYLKLPRNRAQTIEDARKLLGVTSTANSRDIREAWRRRTAIIHPDRGGSTAAMQELNAARDLLLADAPPELPEHSE